jgi:NAD(P)H-hydrate epimerase
LEILTSGLLEAIEARAVTIARMKEIEDDGERLGISKNLMMENAGSSIANFIFQNSIRFNPVKTMKTRVFLVGGTGNNGGDVFVAARHLAYWNDSFQVSVALIGSEIDFKTESTKSNFSILKRSHSVEVIVIDSEAMLTTFSGILNQAHVVVIGIFGTGFRGEARGLQSHVIELINEKSETIKISVDIPSGLEADSGLASTVVLSDYTITMHSPKLGMFKGEKAEQSCGRILIANIGIPE